MFEVIWRNRFVIFIGTFDQCLALLGPVKYGAGITLRRLKRELPE